MLYLISGIILCLTSLTLMANLETVFIGGILIIFGFYFIKKGREKLGWKKTK